jgi:hypothetical protein
MFVIPALGVKQEDQEFKGSSVYVVRLCVKQQQQQQRNSGLPINCHQQPE